jgi:hypothetical protein
MPYYWTETEWNGLSKNNFVQARFWFVRELIHIYQDSKLKHSDNWQWWLMYYIKYTEKKKKVIRKS